MRYARYTRYTRYDRYTRYTSYTRYTHHTRYTRYRPAASSCCATSPSRVTVSSSERGRAWPTGGRRWATRRRAVARPCVWKISRRKVCAHRTEASNQPIIVIRLMLQWMIILSREVRPPTKHGHEASSHQRCDRRLSTATKHHLTNQERELHTLTHTTLTHVTHVTHVTRVTHATRVTHVTPVTHVTCFACCTCDRRDRVARLAARHERECAARRGRYCWTLRQLLWLGGRARATQHARY